MKVIVTGGGSGGHISPILAVIKSLENIDKELQVLYIGSKKGMENKIIPKTGIPFKSIETGKIRRYYANKLLNVVNPTTFFANVKDIYKMIKGVSGASKILKSFKPDVVFVKGGFVGFPVGLAAKLLKIPYVVHESDLIPGMANKILSKWADKMLVSYPVENFKDLLDEKKLVYTGTPLREDLLDFDIERGYENFSFTKDIPIIMFIGGSQGARAINTAIEESLEDLLFKYQIIHICGESDYERAKYRSSKLPNDLKEKYRLFEFLSADLKDAYAISTLVVSRAGNNVLTELAALKKPSLLIPYPWMNNHQYENALVYSRVGAAHILEESDLNPSSLFRNIERLVENKEELSYMSKKVETLYKKDAAKEIAEIIMKVGEKGKKKEYAGKKTEKK